MGAQPLYKCSDGHRADGGGWGNEILERGKAWGADEGLRISGSGLWVDSLNVEMKMKSIN
jgi:hypothetical protein